MTYTAVSAVDIGADASGGASLDAEWAFCVEPGYSGSRIDPPYGPSVSCVQLISLTNGKDVVPCPEWLATAIEPTEEWFLEQAGEQDYSARADERDYREAAE